LHVYQDARKRIEKNSLLLLLSILTSTAWSSPRRSVRLAICQILVIDSDREGNFRRIEYTLEQVQAQRADIAIFPESSILGWENPDAHSIATPIPGRDSDRIAALAQKYRVMIAHRPRRERRRPPL
jgi:predicted amidohydrolase